MVFGLEFGQFGKEDEAVGKQFVGQMQDQASGPPLKPTMTIQTTAQRAAAAANTATPSAVVTVPEGVNPQTIPEHPSYEPLVLTEAEKQEIAAKKAADAAAAPGAPGVPAQPMVTPEQEADPWMPREGETQEQATARADAEEDDNYEFASTALQNALDQRAAYENSPEWTEEELLDVLWPNGEWYPGRTDIARNPTDADRKNWWRIKSENHGRRPNPTDDEIAHLQGIVDTYGRNIETPGDEGIGFDDQPRNRFPVAQTDAGGRSRIPLFDTQNEEGRKAQQQFINMIYQSALGNGPSAAQDLLSKDREKAIRQARQAGVAGGAAGMRGAQNAQGDIEGNMAREAAMRRSQEQQFAQQLLGQGIEQMRGSDLGAFSATANVIDIGAGRDLEASGQLANLLTGGAKQELQAESQTVAAQNLRGQLNLSVEQLEHQVIQNLNVNELKALELQLRGLTIQESDSLFTKLVGLGVEGTKAYLSGGTSLAT